MTYRLIKLLDRLHLEACTCFTGLDAGLRSFIMLLAAAAISFICPHLPRHHLKGRIYKIDFVPAVKAAFCFLYATPSSSVSKLKGGGLKEKVE